MHVIHELIKSKIVEVRNLIKFNARKTVFVCLLILIIVATLKSGFATKIYQKAISDDSSISKVVNSAKYEKNKFFNDFETVKNKYTDVLG